MKIFIWTRSLEHLYFYTWKSVQSQLSEQITFVLTDPENLVRKNQGWQPIDISKLDVIIMQRKGWLRQSLEILDRYPDAIHVFWGFWSDRRLFPLIIICEFRGMKTVVLNEHYSTSPVGYMKEESFFFANAKVLLRPVLYGFAALILKIASYRKNPICVFAISPQAYKQYIKAGFDPKTLFPFGYFIPAINVLPNAREISLPLRIVFVAALLKRKGLDIAICALQNINQNGIKITLDVYGSGDPKAFIPDSSDFIKYKGIIPIEQSQSVIAQYDALILPSRHDGWGVVVNESLMQNVPVIISDHVGARSLVDFTGAGFVFKSESVDDLVNCLTKILEKPTILKIMRDNAGSVKNYITPEVGAKYFVDALLYYFDNEGTRPNIPWS